jgi:hypothetical protein
LTSWKEVPRSSPLVSGTFFAFMIDDRALFSF